MSRLLFTNNAVAIVPLALAPSSTMLVVEAGFGALFPNPASDEYFKLVLEDRRVNPVRREIVHCTARSVDTFTIVRAREGTSAQVFNAGYVAAVRMTAEAAQILVDAVANFGTLWLGVHATPPITDNEGGPLAVGALYFNSVTFTNYAWDGAQWRAQLLPATAVTMRLFYEATGGQTDFGNALDLWGNTLDLNTTDLQPVLVYKNGQLLFLDDGSATLGDYTVDHATNRITLLTPAALNDRVELQQLAVALTIGVVDVRKLRDIDLDPGAGTPGYINGARVTFKLRDLANDPVTPDSTLTLRVYLDGVPQEPSVNYTVATDEITFDEVLPAGTDFWGVYYASMAA